jgi:hypothetical protein
MYARKRVICEQGWRNYNDRRSGRDFTAIRSWTIFLDERIRWVCITLNVTEKWTQFYGVEFYRARNSWVRSAVEWLRRGILQGQKQLRWNDYGVEFYRARNSWVRSAVEWLRRGILQGQKQLSEERCGMITAWNSTGPETAEWGALWNDYGVEYLVCQWQCLNWLSDLVMFFITEICTKGIDWVWVVKKWFFSVLGAYSIVIFPVLHVHM